VEAFGSVLGKSLPVRFVAPGESIPGLPEIVSPVLAGMETYDSPIPMQATATSFGVKMTPLSMTIQSMLNIPAS
jgi:NADH dehydrogenase